MATVNQAETQQFEKVRSSVAQEPKQNGAATVVQKRTQKKKQRNKRALIIILSVIALGAIVWYFTSAKTAKTQSVLRYGVVDVGDITKIVTATGTLQATHTVQVG